MAMWFAKKMNELSNDSQLIAECKLIDLTETICIIHGKKRPNGLSGILFWLLEWSANKLIWDMQPRAKEK